MIHIGAICNCWMPTLNMIRCCAWAQVHIAECWHKPYEIWCPSTVKLSRCTNVKNYVILHLAAFTTGMVCDCNCYDTRSGTTLQSSQCNNVKLCDCAPDAITVALLAIWIVKANKNQISYDNTIELNFLLRGMNLFLKRVVNNDCLWPFHVRTWE